MLVLDGKIVAQKIKDQVKSRASEFRQKRGASPGLTVILIGEDPASEVYVKNKIAACAEAGIVSNEIRKSKNTSAAEIKEIILQLNTDSKVHGILVQLPLPEHLNSDEVLSWIDPQKDPDGLTIENLGLLVAGRPRVKSCTPAGVMEILKHYNIEVAGKNAVVIGRSNIVGKPMAQLLQMADATVTVCHSRTSDLKTHTLAADILVVAAGKPEFIGREHCKKNAVVIDVGIHRKEAKPAEKPKLCGDVKFDELKDWASAATPVPGGVGPMTIAMLLSNTMTLAESV